MTNPRSPFPKDNLTAAAFEGLLQRLDHNRERAGEKYEEIRWKLVKFFQWGSCFAAEDLVDETFNRVAEKVASEQQGIQDVAGFVWGVAKKVRQEALRNEAKTVRLPDLRSVETFLADQSIAAKDDVPGYQRHLRCLRRCIQSFSGADRSLLLTYYSPRGHRPEARRRLAEEHGITLLTLRVRANRLRFKLEESIRNCLSSATD